MVKKILTKQQLEELIVYQKDHSDTDTRRTFKLSESRYDEILKELGICKHSKTFGKQTCLEKYGVDSYSKTTEYLDKQYKTKKKNNSFNTSQPENFLYKKLCTIYKVKDILRQYKDERYPFNCDFYIKSLDLFIELNAHWSHGGKPYNSDDEECRQKLAIWKEKAKKSKFYQNAINVWTISDVNKLKTFKTNNLNYVIFYSIKDALKQVEYFKHRG